MKIITIGSQDFHLSDIEEVLESRIKLEISAETKQKIKECHTYLAQKLVKEEQSYYGINTGFGYLCNVTINAADIQQLQLNLVRSHACGTGEPISRKVSRLTLFLKILNLCRAHSGVSIGLVEKLISFFNEDLMPVMYEYGSLGASGDLAPLAHLSLPLLGEGELWENDKIVQAKELLLKRNVESIALQAKEGLALLNGTQFSTAFASRNLIHAKRLLHLSNLIAAFSLEAYQCDLSPFFPELHQIRAHQGQIKVAEEILQFLNNKTFQTKHSVQDPYSFRCIPQVHGASMDTIEFVAQTIDIEINAVTDNPNIFPQSDQILSGGNFHAQAIAFANDYMSICLAELGNISERRSFNLLNGERGLPEFLSPSPGLNSGMMIAQYTAASLVSSNKQLATPASVDSISSSKGQEDHVSMAANAGTQCYKVVDNLYRILAIEFMLANQALEFIKPKRFSGKLIKARENYRSTVTALNEDRVLYTDLDKTVSFIKELGKQGSL